MYVRTCIHSRRCRPGCLRILRGTGLSSSPSDSGRGDQAARWKSRSAAPPPVAPRGVVPVFPLAHMAVVAVGGYDIQITMADLTSSQNLAVGEHKLTVHIMRKVGTSVECPLTFTVDPIPLSGTPTFGSGEGKTLGEVEVTYPERWPTDVTFTLTWGRSAARPGPA